MNPIFRHLILQKIRAYVKARKEGKVKRFSFVKSLEKLGQGGTITLIATILGLFLDSNVAETEGILNDVIHNIRISIPVLGGLFISVVNAIKFFTKRKLNKGGETR